MTDSTPFSVWRLACLVINGGHLALRLATGGLGQSGAILFVMALNAFVVVCWLIEVLVIMFREMGDWEPDPPFCGANVFILVVNTGSILLQTTLPGFADSRGRMCLVGLNAFALLLWAIGALRWLDNCDIPETVDNGKSAFPAASVAPVEQAEQAGSAFSATEDTVREEAPELVPDGDVRPTPASVAGFLDYLRERADRVETEPYGDGFVVTVWKRTIEKAGWLSHDLEKGYAMFPGTRNVFYVKEKPFVTVEKR